MQLKDKTKKYGFLFARFLLFLQTLLFIVPFNLNPSFDLDEFDDNPVAHEYVQIDSDIEIYSTVTRTRDRYDFNDWFLADSRNILSSQILDTISKSFHNSDHFVSNLLSYQFISLPPPCC